MSNNCHTGQEYCRWKETTVWALCSKKVDIKDVCNSILIVNSYEEECELLKTDYLQITDFVSYRFVKSLVYYLLSNYLLDRQSLISLILQVQYYEQKNGFQRTLFTKDNTWKTQSI